MKWTHENIPDQSGKVAVVTGANTGIGFETARWLAKRGAEVTLACRSQVKGEDAAARIRAEQPSGSATFAPLDLADLESVSAFARQFSELHDHLDLLINNAGVMVPPKSRTKQGFELQFGVNHLGHFALTGQLVELIDGAPAARVVTVSSAAHRGGRMNFDDLNFEQRGYQPWRAYGQSKLANLLFTLQLQQRFAAAGSSAIAVAAHPGWTGTDLQRTAWVVRLMNPLFGMQPDQGALPTLYAATAPGVRGGEYFGPNGFQEVRGYPVRVGTSKAANSKADAERLWHASESLTGIRYGRGSNDDAVTRQLEVQ